MRLMLYSAYTHSLVSGLPAVRKHPARRIIYLEGDKYLFSFWMHMEYGLAKDSVGHRNSGRHGIPEFTSVPVAVLYDSSCILHLMCVCFLAMPELG